MTEKHLARRAERSAGPHPHPAPQCGLHGIGASVQGSGWGPPCSQNCPLSPTAPIPSNSQTHLESDFQFFYRSHTTVHKIFLFYIFYTNVTKKAGEGRGLEGRQTVFMPVNGLGKDKRLENVKHTVSTEIARLGGKCGGARKPQRQEGSSGFILVRWCWAS